MAIDQGHTISLLAQPGCNFGSKGVLFLCLISLAPLGAGRDLYAISLSCPSSETLCCALPSEIEAYHQPRYSLFSAALYMSVGG